MRYYLVIVLKYLFTKIYMTATRKLTQDLRYKNVDENNNNDKGYPRKCKGICALL